MGQAFIIMQIGNPDLDQMCERAIVPALDACGLVPKRVDKHNKGDLLKSEIINFIRISDIIVADLTNERPNCYLEVGYTMGIGKNTNLILTVREDHMPDSPRHRAGGPKVHFDLSGYEILPWYSDNLEGFRIELEKLIRRRLANIARDAGAGPTWDEEWIARQRAAARVNPAGTATPPEEGQAEHLGIIEIMFALVHPKPNKDLQELRKAAHAAYMGGFANMGIVDSHGRDSQPRPTAEGLVADADPVYRWALRRNGDFYQLFRRIGQEAEGEHHASVVVEWIVGGIAEALIYCRRLYQALGAPANTAVIVCVRLYGLQGRVLELQPPAGSRRQRAFLRNVALGRQPTAVDEIGSEERIPLERIPAELVTLVKALAAPLFMVFDYFELSDDEYEVIVREELGRLRPQEP